MQLIITQDQARAGFFAVDAATREVGGVLLPYGESSRRNMTGDAPVYFQRGDVTIPADVTVLNANIGHDRMQPFAAFQRVEDTDAGMLAFFRIAQSPEGDAFLAEHADPTKPKRRLSAEVANLTRHPDNPARGRASLFGAAFVPEGAFASASLFAVDAIGEGAPSATDDMIDPLTNAVPITPTDDTIELVASEFPGTVTVSVIGYEPRNYTSTDDTNPTSTDDQQEGTNVTAAESQFGTRERTAPAVTIRDIGAALFAAKMGTITDDQRRTLDDNNAASLFALSDIRYNSGTGNLSSAIGLPQWIGEVWNALTYRQQVLPLFNHQDLTALSIQGFRWTTKPMGGDWAGNKADVPSNTLVVAPVTGTADRYAVGHDIAREFVDFNTPGFFESYAAATAEDYAKWADGKVAAAALAGATALTADALTTLPGASGGTIGSAASAIIDGAAVLVANGALPDFALVAPALWKQLVKQPKNNIIGYFNSALGLDEGDLTGFTIRPSASIAAGKVLVGARQAVTVYELPGAPIRIDALDLARGGVDKAAFGYVGTVVNDARGLQLVTAATA